MADGTDHPAHVGVTGSAPSESVAAGPVADLPPTDAQPYQPVSPLAIAALVVAVIFAAVVVLGGVFAMFSRTPWLLPIWTILLPLCAAAVAFVARYQIRRSEGTRSGMALTSWAVGLSAGIGIVYGMYYLGTFLAVRSQAQSFADRWLQKVAAGKTEEAFFDTTKPPRKILRTADDADEKAALRRIIEVAYNSPPDAAQRGAFSGFSSSEYVRLLQLAGSKAKIDFAGVKDWEYEKGGFSVTLTYRIVTDLATIPLQVKVHGSESSSNEFPGRQWNVVIEDTGVEPTSGGIQYTNQGRELRWQILLAFAPANEWVEALSRGQFNKVYADMLDAKERVRAVELHTKYLLPSQAIGPFPVTDDAGRRYLEARLEVAAGGPVRIEDGVFWADAALRPTVEAEVKAIFDPTKAKPRRLSLQTGAPPLVSRDEKRLRLGFDVQLVIPQDEPTQPPIVVEGRVIIGADLADVTDLLDSTGKSKKAPPSQDVWRIEALELVRGRNAPKAPPPGGGNRPRG